jgi:hypothetical protein
MFDAHTTAMLRAVLNDVCRKVSVHDTGTRTHVAVKILEAAKQGETLVDGLKRVGWNALREAHTTHAAWR